MFTRNADVKTTPPRPAMSPTPTLPQAAMPGAASPTQMPRGEARAISVIGNDLKIMGQGLKIVSEGTLQVDGEVEGDVRGAEVIIGEKGKVSGTVIGERVVVRGQITGVIRGVSVTLLSSSRVEGDIYHSALVIEQGASFDGSCKRAKDVSELQIESAQVQRGAPAYGVPRDLTAPARVS
jgi:cytoskeletal protein CcmA (bactofilin family)